MRFGTSTTEYALTGPAVNEALSTAKSLPLDTKYYLYNRDGTSYYMTQAEVENKATDDGYKGEMFAYRRDNSVKVEDKTYNNCTLIQDSTGKFQYITLPDGSQYTLSLEEVTDDVGYEAAMQQYNYDKMVYDKTIADINAQTEQIQAQDRTLELRLKQLDTEQEALQTEMDAVKKVIEKNVENTFKTFA